MVGPERTPEPRPESATVRAQLASGRKRLARAEIPTAWLDAEVLLAHVFATRREWLHSHPEHSLTSRQRTRYEHLLRRRVARTPVAYLTSEREFYGHTLRVTPAVLIPRPETELLVDLAIAWLNDHPDARRVIDLGTGSGAIAIAIARAVRNVRVRATDVDPRAVGVAAANVAVHRLSSRITVVRRDMLRDAGKADLIVANLPYLSAARRRAWAAELEFEPAVALNGGKDGLDVIRRALTTAPAVLRPTGCLLLECDPLQSQRIVRLGQQQWPSAEISIHKDLAGKDRAVRIQLA